MKEHKVKDRRRGVLMLEVHLTRGESLDYNLAERLRVNPHPVLLRFKYEMKGKNGDKSILYYDISGCITLRDYLRMGITGEQYIQLLCAIGALGNLSSSAGIPLEAMCFDIDSLYVCNGSLMFCCLPVNPLQARGTILGLLGYLANPANVRFVLPDDARLTRYTIDYVNRVSIFSAFDFNEFMLRSFGRNLDGADHGYNRGNMVDASYGSTGTHETGTAKNEGNVFFNPFADATPDSQGAAESRAEPATAAVNTGSVPSSARTSVSQVDEKTLTIDEETLPSLLHPRAREGKSESAKPDASSSQTPLSTPAHSQGEEAAIVSDPNPGTSLLVASTGQGGQRKNPTPAAVEDRFQPQYNAGFASEPASVQLPQAVTPQQSGAHSGVPSGFPESSSAAGSQASAGAVVSQVFTIVRDRDGSSLCRTQVDASVGRSSRCVARITGNTNVSRMHALITDLGGGRFAVEDLGSGNGTVVRGVRLGRGERAQVSVGERFNVADETIHIER